MTGLHRLVTAAVIVGFAALLLWVLVLVVAGRRPRALDSALAAGVVLLVLDALVGLALLVAGHRPRQLGLHLLYGGLALVLVPAAAGYVRGRRSRWDVLVLGVACMAVVVVAQRAGQTGAP